MTMLTRLSASHDDVTSALVRYRGALKVGEPVGIVEAMVDLCRCAREFHSVAQDALFDFVMQDPAPRG